MKSNFCTCNPFVGAVEADALPFCSTPSDSSAASSMWEEVEVEAEAEAVEDGSDC